MASEDSRNRDRPRRFIMLCDESDPTEPLLREVRALLHHPENGRERHEVGSLGGDQWGVARRTARPPRSARASASRRSAGADDDGYHDVNEPDYPLLDAWPFLLIVRTGRIVTVHFHTLVGRGATDSTAGSTGFPAYSRLHSTRRRVEGQCLVHARLLP